MFICYIDESGFTGPRGWNEQRVLVVSGVLVNAYRAPKTRRDWVGLLNDLGKIAEEPLAELKGRDLFRGGGSWSGCGHEGRAAARAQVLDWLRDRGHKIVASGVQHERLEGARDTCTPASELEPYLVAAMHVALQVQRHQHAPGDRKLNKKLTLLIFDRQAKLLENQLARLLARPPDWAMGFVNGRCTEADGLPVVLDSAYFADSQQAPLIQVADFVCYMLQRKSALDSGADPSFDGEQEILDDVFADLQPLIIDASHRFPRRGGCFARYVEQISPDTFLPR